MRPFFTRFTVGQELTVLRRDTFLLKTALSAQNGQFLTFRLVLLQGVSPRVGISPVLASQGGVSSWFCIPKRASQGGFPLGLVSRKGPPMGGFSLVLYP